MDVWALKHLIFLSFAYYTLSAAQLHDFPTAKVPTSWTINNLTVIQAIPYNKDETKIIRIVLLKQISNTLFGCGFINVYGSFVFAIGVFPLRLSYPSNISQTLTYMEMVWSANRNNPVSQNATLQLTQDGDLILKEVDGTLVWSTNTSNKSVVGMNLTENGNLVLFDRHNTTIWQSFDHPTDSLLPGQKLVQGQRLIAGVSTTNSTEGRFSLSVTPRGLFAFLQSDRALMYYKFLVHGTKESIEPSYVRFLNGALSLFILSAEPNEPDAVIPMHQVSTTSQQYMRLESNGHLRIYEWDAFQWNEVGDILTDYLGDCGYPTVCENFEICSNGQCSCPGSFAEDNSTSGGCPGINPLSCQTSPPPTLLQVQNIYYFNYVDDDAADFRGIDVESCKQKCLTNCSCKAALFRYYYNVSVGDCFLPSPVLSLISDERGRSNYKSTAFIKMQLPSADQFNGRKTHRTAMILGLSFSVFFVAVLTIGVWVVVRRKKKYEEGEEYLDHVPGMPMRFSFAELKAATDNFHKKLGEGGFGSVFEGTLSNGVKVAVKRLDHFSQGKKEFLAEVNTIGSIHHVNLVRLIGFSAEKSHCLLVYEYMCNGSLDKWIFNRSQSPTLDWQTKQKFIIDIAKGLAYLHEGCRQRIVHLDIKPQNILLDENFVAKVSDFGLSKLLDRDQSQVVTTMRGTPGYLAPEWLNSTITEKVDVYSFGVVVLEIVCGRKNLDHSQPEESVHLLSLLKKMAEEGELFDIVKRYNDDMHVYQGEALKMIQTAMWCLHNDFTRRPSMSLIVKFLEGAMDVEPNLDYSYFTEIPPTILQRETDLGVSEPILPSILSGPR